MNFTKCLLLLILTVSGFLYAQEFNVPESVAFDQLKNRYFISNYGDGNIILIDSAGEKTCFKKELSKSLGMIIHQNILYVVENPNTIKGFDISNGSPVLDLHINEALFLNDITCDDSGHLYITDSNAKAVFKINIIPKTYSLFVKTELDNPNGIVYDKLNNRLVVCYFRENAPLDAISLEDSTISTIKFTGFDNLDGLTQDESGNFYVSSWGSGNFSSGFKKEGTIYKYDNLFTKEPVIVSTGHLGPADIYFNIQKNELAIPLFLENNVIFLPLKQD
jgi:DNA-binding beta-propeller fold protein YncE